MKNIFEGDNLFKEIGRITKGYLIENGLAEEIDTSKLTDVVVSGIKAKDYPEFVDAYISSAKFNGIELTEFELDTLNEDRDFVHEQVVKKLN